MEFDIPNIGSDLSLPDDFETAESLIAEDIAGISDNLNGQLHELQHLVAIQDSHLLELRRQADVLTIQSKELKKQVEASERQAAELERHTKLAIKQAENADKEARIARRHSRIAIALSLVVAVKEVIEFASSLLR